MMNDEADEVIEEIFDSLKRVAILTSTMFKYCITNVIK